jgi:hypothetical protein
LGGTIVHDSHGNPTGMLHDTADDQVYNVYNRYVATLPPAVNAARREKELKLSVENAISRGITTFDDMGESFKTVDWLKQQSAAGLPLRLYINIAGESVAALDAHLADYRTTGYAKPAFHRPRHRGDPFGRRSRHAQRVVSETLR